MNKLYASLKGLFVFGLMLCWGVGFGQMNEWTWLKGNTTRNDVSVYGIQGVSSPLNKPGGRERGMSSQDKAGNLWLFGGRLLGTFYDNANDLWKYNLSTNEWVWVSGDTIPNRSGNYGTKGISSPSNKPGARYSCVSWSDTSGNIWLFGGSGEGAASVGTYSFLNDLWVYNTTSNLWTWMKGDSADTKGFYGTIGVGSQLNHPPGRELASTWVDTSGNLWLFGGFTLVGSNFRDYDDLWKYSPTLNEWTWVKGDTMPLLTKGVFGIKGVSSSNNLPGTRSGGSAWTDAANNLWLFGGLTASGGYSAAYNDLWKYNILTNKWTWINGDSTFFSSSVYGIKGVSSPLNKPGARGAAMNWTDSKGFLWLMGGECESTSAFGNKNDLWRYDPNINEWTWVKNDTTIYGYGVYGTQGVSSPNNKPGGRYGGYTWKDTADNMYLFGGSGLGATLGGALSDLWRYSPDTSSSLPLHLLTFTAKRANTTNLLNWTTAQEVNTDRFEIERSTNSKEFNKIGTLKAGNTSYSFTDNNPLNGANYYRLKMLDKDGAFTYSPIRQINIKSSTFNIVIYPNPAKDKLQLQIENDKQTTLNVQVVTQDGKVVLSKQVAVPQGASVQSINITHLGAGHYFLKVLSADKEPVVIGFEKTL